MTEKLLKFDQEKNLVDLSWTTILAPSTQNPSEKVPVLVKTILLELFMKYDQELEEKTWWTRDWMVTMLKDINSDTLKINEDTLNDIKKLINYRWYDNVVYINIVDAFTPVEN